VGAALSTDGRSGKGLRSQTLLADPLIVQHATNVVFSEGSRSASRQALSGLRKTIAALFWMAIALYGVGWFILGGAVDRGGATVLAVRLLGVMLICTSANVVRATVKRRAIRTAWFLNVSAASGVVVLLYFLLEK